MKFKDLIQIVISSILATNKIRSGLTMLGVTVGVVLIVGGTIVLESFVGKYIKDMEVMGGSEFWIVSKIKERLFFGIEPEAFILEISMKDIQAIMKQCPAVRSMAPISQSVATVKYGDNNLMFTMRGTSPLYTTTRDSKLISGRFFTDAEMSLRSKVCVMEKSKDIDPFFDKASIGDKLIMNGYPFTIIGFIETPAEYIKPGKLFLIYIPLSTMQETFGIRKMNLAIGKAINSESILEATDQTKRVLLQRYGYPSKFSVLNFTQILSQIEESKKIGRSIVYAIAFLSLLAGGIGVMNIMYVSILERVREIGLLKALGAKKRYIMDQFLLESIFICFLGGILGILIGISASFSVALFLRLTYQVPVWALIVGFILPVLVGILAGFYPAKFAADLNPVEALRYE